MFWKREKKREKLTLSTVNKRLIEKAFIVGGVQYWRFKSEFDIPIMRFSWFEKFISDFQIKTDAELYRGTLEAMEKELNTSGGVNLARLGQLIGILKDRLEYFFPPDIAYKMASVLFFDESENLAEWDQDYNEAKIEIWKTEKAGFFLTDSMKSLFPSLKQLGDDLPTFLKNYETMKKAHIQIIQNSK